MENNIKEVVFILDRSGSMSGKESDVIGSFNGMLQKFKKEHENTFLTTVLFDNYSTTLHDRLPISQVEPITEKDYYTKGCTALLDSVGDTVNHIKEIHRYIRPEDVPTDVTIIINTDGLENASHKYTKDQIKSLILSQKELGWEFLFVGADFDSFDSAASIGITKERVINRSKRSKDCYSMAECADFCLSDPKMREEIVKNANNITYDRK